MSVVEAVMIRNFSRRFPSDRELTVCVGLPLFVASPAEMQIATYAEGHFSRLDPKIELDTQGQYTCDINEPGG
jgi:hypothetical protein